MAFIELLERMQPTALSYAMPGIISLEALVSSALKIPLQILEPTAAGSVHVTLVFLEMSPPILMCALLACQGHTRLEWLWLIVLRVYFADLGRIKREAEGLQQPNA